jgi:hypothetical protein
VISRFLKCRAAQPQSVIGNFCLGAKLVRVQCRRSTGEIPVVEFDLCSKKLRKQARPLAAETRLDTGDIFFGRNSTVTRRLSKISERLFFGLLGGAANAESSQRESDAGKKRKKSRKHF